MLIRSLLDSLQFIKYIQHQDDNSKENLYKSINFSQSNLSLYLMHPNLTFPTMDQYGNQRIIHVSQVTTLICFTKEALLEG
jgi:hypothetical protein